MENGIVEEYYQANLKYFAREKKKIPLEISVLEKDLNDIKQEYAAAVVKGNQFIIKEYQRILNAKEYDLKSYEEQSELLREPQKQDIAYRLKQYQEFPEKAAQSISDDKMLCFHGTTIIGAKNIILSGGIFSGADRFGRSTSYDPPGKISVTNKDSVETSSRTYMRLIDNFCYPAGCLFVVSAKDKAEYQNLSSCWMIDNVDFKKNPERLVAIISTPENLERLRQWAKENGVDGSKVMDFEKFIHTNNNKNYMQANVINMIKNGKTWADNP